MNSRTQIWISAAAIFFGLLVSYALAEQKPAAATAEAASPSCPMEHGGKPCCGHGAGMHGEGHEHGPGAMSCPLMGMDRPEADVRVEKTANGAVIRLTAKNPADAAQVQKMALMIGIHLGADAGALLPASKEPTGKH